MGNIAVIPSFIYFIPAAFAALIFHFPIFFIFLAPSKAFIYLFIYFLAAFLALISSFFHFIHFSGPSKVLIYLFKK